ncbi:helix-turn-helix domain-containing protein [Thermomicrobium sp.]|uniref:helix-turn-helix domain-containing protein n=1 Tax=Thermomicrobium sp. TaxID=1969469 RepID=UPI001B2C5418|nr:helix-turn-helix domain-containing protein [Thermomicrobium sp.]MBO9308007.1 helix-turn-helix domain-containing protein [Thermomicrobium sp.]
MINRERLCHVMRLRGMTYRDVAEALGFSVWEWYRRLEGKTPWRRSELELLADILDCPVGYLRGTMDEDELLAVAQNAKRDQRLVERWVGPTMTGWDIVYAYERLSSMKERTWRP